MRHLEQEILNLYFEECLKQKDIAKRLGISNSKVSRIVTKDSRYPEEKERRKEISKIKHSESAKRIMKKKRERIKFEKNADDLLLRKMHNQASMELSKNSRLSDMAYRNWNTSAYKYNEEKKRYEFREELGRSYDVKKYLKGKI